MKEIKFRIWDKINKRWIKLWKLCFAVTGELMAIEDIDGEIYGLHQVDLVQYTGLKDKNGKEIYEGDIAESWNLTDKEGNPAICEVKWDRNFYLIESPLYGCTGLHIADGRFGIEVIGNIYESPELLEVK